MTPQRWILILSMFALAVSSAALWDATRSRPGTVSSLEAQVAEEREAGTPIGTTDTATLLTVSGGDQPTFGTSGNNNLVFSSSWMDRTWLTVGPFPTASSEPPLWLEFHDTLPNSFIVRVQGGKTWTLGELRGK